jgi:hypothetical protein
MEAVVASGIGHVDEVFLGRGLRDFGDNNRDGMDSYFDEADMSS